MKSRLGVTILYLVLLAACGPRVNDPYEPLVSGVKGQALVGPMCPVMQAQSPCPDQPYQTSLLILKLDGGEVARVDTDAEGKFMLNLPPGDYILHPRSGSTPPTAADVPFTVLTDQMTNIIITFDSGIR
jgi:hypothetical protein